MREWTRDEIVAAIERDGGIVYPDGSFVVQPYGRGMDGYTLLGNVRDIRMATIDEED